MRPTVLGRMLRLGQPRSDSMSSPTRDWKVLAVGSVLILFCTLLVYWPALQAGFIWDDDLMLTDNAAIKSPGGLFFIWCSTALPDYFPLTSTTFWLEWRLWGMKAGGYHITNVLLHALSA